VIKVFWYLAPCLLVNRWRHFAGNFYLHIQSTCEVDAAGVTVIQASTAQLGFKKYKFKDPIKDENIKNNIVKY
jgi:hypothetical protein